MHRQAIRDWQILVVKYFYPIRYRGSESYIIKEGHRLLTVPFLRQLSIGDS